MDNTRSAHQLVSVNQDDNELTFQIMPSFSRSNMKEKYQFCDREVLKPELAKKLADPTYKPGGIEPFANQQGHFQYPEYNFSEIVTILETEPLVARAFSRKEIMCLKEGYDFVGKNQKTLDYIKIRLQEIKHVSNVSTEQLIRDIATDLITFSNWFGTYVRNKKLSSGRRRNIGGRNLDPIAGIYTVPIETVILRFNQKGDVDAIGQQIYGDGFGEGTKRNVFGKDKFVHFKILERKGYSVGTPLLVATKDDIMALRRIEENVEILLYQYLFPLYTYQVGTETAPARELPGGVSEIDMVQRRWSELPPEGAIVVPERHKIDVLGAKGSAIDAEPYLEYFKKRVLAGLEISSLDIGDASTSNRSTSDSLSRILVDGVKYLQRRIEWHFNNHIIQPLLLESTFSDQEVLDPDNAVFLKFREIDVDALIKHQNHAQQMYSSHGITETEYRRELGREPLSEEERNDTFWKRVDEPRELLKSKTSGFSAEGITLSTNENSSITPESISEEQKAEEESSRQKQAASQSAANPTLTSGQRQSSSQANPSNQFSNKSFYDLVFKNNLQTANPSMHQVSQFSLSSYWNDALDQLKLNSFIPEESYKMLAINLYAASNSFQKLLLSKVYEGIKDVLDESDTPAFVFDVKISSLMVSDIKKQVTKLIDNLLLDARNKLSNSNNHELLPIDLINTLTYRVRFIDNNELSRSYNLGRALAFRYLNYNEVKIIPMLEDSCESCKVIKIVDLSNLSYLDMPPASHPNARQIVIPNR